MKDNFRPKTGMAPVIAGLTRDLGNSLAAMVTSFYLRHQMLRGSYGVRRTSASKFDLQANNRVFTIRTLTRHP
jgi:hypothetical protein